MRGPGGFKARWWEEKSMPRRVGIYIDTPQGVCITREGWPVQRPLPGVPPRRSNRWPWLAIRRRFLEIRRRRLWSGRSRRLVRSIICTVRLLEPWTRPGFCSQTDRKFIKKTVSVITLSREILLQTWIALTVSVNGGFWEQRLQVSDVWEAQLWSNMASVYPPDSGLFEFLFFKFNRTERGEKYVVWHGIKVKKCIKKITQIVILIEQLKIICKMLIEKSFFRL